MSTNTTATNVANVVHESASNVAKLAYENAIKSHQEDIEMLGLELEYASGVRAVAAEEAIRKRGLGRDYFDADLLLEECDLLVGQARLFESYDDGCNTNPTDFVLGEGIPFDAFDGYLDLYELFGDNWLVLAATEYAARRENEGVNEDPRRKAEEMVARAREEYAKARATGFEVFFLESNKRRAA